MAIERKMRIAQEDRYYDLHLLERLAENKEFDELVERLFHMCEKAQNGMTSTEVDAVRERVSRTLKRRKNSF